MRSCKRLLCALALAMLCVAAHFQGACCRGGASGGGHGVGGGGHDSVGGGGHGVGESAGRGGYSGGAGAAAVAAGAAARGSSPGHKSSSFGARERGAWRVAVAGACLAAAAVFV